MFVLKPIDYLDRCVFKPGSHCAITNRDSSFDAQIGPLSSATISNMFDIVALGDRNVKVIASYKDKGNPIRRWVSSFPVNVLAWLFSL